MNASIEEIAELAHEVNRTYCQEIGDDSQPPWVDAPALHRAYMVESVLDPRKKPRESGRIVGGASRRYRYRRGPDLSARIRAWMSRSSEVQNRGPEDRDRWPRPRRTADNDRVRRDPPPREETTFMTLSLCTALLLAHPHASTTTYTIAWHTCVSVAIAAELYDVDPDVAVAVMYMESKGDPDAVGDNGRARGPMQVHPALWCRDGLHPLPCGVRALARLVHKHGRDDGLCFYAQGNKHRARSGRGCAYAHKVTRLL